MFSIFSLVPFLSLSFYLSVNNGFSHSFFFSCNACRYMLFFSFYASCHIFLFPIPCFFFLMCYILNSFSSIYSTSLGSFQSVFFFFNLILASKGFFFFNHPLHFFISHISLCTFFQTAWSFWKYLICSYVFSFLYLFSNFKQDYMTYLIHLSPEGFKTVYLPYAWFF